MVGLTKPGRTATEALWFVSRRTCIAKPLATARVHLDLLATMCPLYKGLSDQTCISISTSPIVSIGAFKLKACFHIKGQGLQVRTWHLQLSTLPLVPFTLHSVFHVLSCLMKAACCRCIRPTGPVCSPMPVAAPHSLLRMFSAEFLRG